MPADPHPAFVLRWLVALAIAIVAVLIHYAWRAPPAVRGGALPAALRFTGGERA